MDTVLIAIFGTSGFWSVITILINRYQNKKDKIAEAKSVERKALLGLLHDRVYELANYHIRERCISDDEYDNLQYLYKPYKEMGGNGTCERLMKEVEKLPIMKGD